LPARLSDAFRGAVWAAPLAIVAGTIAAGYLLRTHYHRKLGAPNAPMYWFTRIDATWWAFLAALVLAASAWVAPHLLRMPRRRFLWCAAALALATRVALNMSRYGPRELALPLTGPEAPHEYLPSVALFTADPIGYLRHFPFLVATKLPIHAAGHPPGPTVLLGAMQAVWLGGPWPEAIMILVVGAATVYPVYLLGRELSGELDSRLAVLAWLFAPNVLLMSATSMDAVFAFAGTVLAVLILRVRAVAAGFMAAAASFLSYALLAVPVWAVATLLLRHRAPRSLLRPAAEAAAVALGCYLLLWLATGYDPHAAYLATRHAYSVGVSRDRPQRFWFFGDLATFLLGLGIPGVILWSRALERRDAAAVALALVLVIAAGSGYAKAEVERIWLFLVPLAAVSIGPLLRQARLRPVLLAMAAQALLVEVLFGTTW
jgi:hypothetical protein